MILLIDNYDSFSYNLYQLIGSLNPNIQVIRNNAHTVEEIEQMQPSGIILSPGPGRPENAGVCIDTVRRLGAKIPILGICLGHQAICAAFGGNITYAKTLMHGKPALIQTDTTSLLFHHMPKAIQGARYHSLAAENKTLPKELHITAQTDDGEIMAVEHNTHPIYGLQFHPESILTPLGKTIIEHFLEACKYD